MNKTDEAPRACLMYRGTTDEIRLGDRVRLSRFLRKPIDGVVAYIPGESPRHPEMVDNGLDYWGIRLDDGTFISWLFHPEQMDVSRRIRFLHRGSSDSGRELLQPTEELL